MSKRIFIVDFSSKDHRAPGRNHNMLGPSEGCSAGKVPETQNFSHTSNQSQDNKKLHVIFYDMSNEKKTMVV